MYIYKLVNNINKKVYIGQTTETLRKRYLRHTGYSMVDNDTKLYRAMKKYGANNFKIIEIDRAQNKEELDEKEMFWINEYNSINDGYNTALGAIGGDTLSRHPNLKAIRKKLSESKLGSKNPNSSAVKVVDLKDNSSKTFLSMRECQDYMEIPRHDVISKRCRGVIKKPYLNRYTFSYWKV